MVYLKLSIVFLFVFFVGGFPNEHKLTSKNNLVPEKNNFSQLLKIFQKELPKKLKKDKSLNENSSKKVKNRVKAWVKEVHSFNYHLGWMVVGPASVLVDSEIKKVNEAISSIEKNFMNTVQLLNQRVIKSIHLNNEIIQKNIKNGSNILQIELVKNINLFEGEMNITTKEFLNFIHKQIYVNAKKIKDLMLNLKLESFDSIKEITSKVGPIIQLFQNFTNMTSMTFEDVIKINYKVENRTRSLTNHGHEQFNNTMKSLFVQFEKFTQDFTTSPKAYLMICFLWSFPLIMIFYYKILPEFKDNITSNSYENVAQDYETLLESKDNIPKNNTPNCGKIKIISQFMSRIMKTSPSLILFPFLVIMFDLIFELVPHLFREVIIYLLVSQIIDYVHIFPLGLFTDNKEG